MLDVSWKKFVKLCQLKTIGFEKKGILRRMCHSGGRYMRPVGTLVFIFEIGASRERRFAEAMFKIALNSNLYIQVQRYQ